MLDRDVPDYMYIHNVDSTFHNPHNIETLLPTFTLVTTSIGFVNYLRTVFSLINDL